MCYQQGGKLHRRLQHHAVIVCRGFTRVGFVRVVGDSAHNNVVKLQSTHAHGSQAAGQAQTGIHGLYGVAYGLLGLGACRQTHGLGHTRQAVLGLHGRGLGIEGNDGGQKHGVQSAVVQLGVDAAQAVAERMHTAQTFLKRHRALHGGAHHVQTRIAVAAIMRGALNIRPAACQAIQSNAVCRRVEGR